MFPEDHTDVYGQIYWSNPKRCPSPLTFNLNDPLHLSFIYNYANMIASMVGIPEIRDESVVAAMCSECPNKPYISNKIEVPKVTEQRGTENEATKMHKQAPNKSFQNEDDESAIAELMEELALDAQIITHDKIQPAVFELDDETNFQLDCINSICNLRARNWKITECDKIKTKMVAGKIIPSLAGTAGMITGAVTTEIIKLTQSCNDIKKYKNACINLALPTVQFAEPS